MIVLRLRMLQQRQMPMRDDPVCGNFYQKDCQSILVFQRLVWGRQMRNLRTRLVPSGGCPGQNPNDSYRGKHEVCEQLLSGNTLNLLIPAIRQCGYRLHCRIKSSSIAGVLLSQVVSKEMARFQANLLVDCFALEQVVGV